MASGFIRKISELNPNIKNAKVKVVIITKSKPNYFNHKNENRGVITFTVRDSRTTVCNCKFWGSKEKVTEYDQIHRIGNVIVIVNALVATAGQEIFMPKSTSRIVLIANEGAGSLLVSDDLQNLDESNALKELLHISHKPLSTVLRLADVRAHTQAVSVSLAAQQKQQHQLVDLLVMVAKIRPVRVMPNSESAKCLEVIVIDQSSIDGTILSIWHDDWIERAGKNWLAMKTVLHLIDVKVVESAFHKCAILRLGPQTLIYENPVGREVAVLRTFATKLKSTNFENLSFGGGFGDNLPKPEEIRTQMTVKQIYTRLEGRLRDDSAEFTAVLYAAITKFDIDGFGSVLTRRCKSCQRILSSNANGCESEQCLLALSFTDCGDSFEYFFNVNMHLGDHTGTLVEARLAGKVAERLFQMSAIDFRELLARNDERITELKWRFLLNYYKVKLYIKKASAVQRLSIAIVDAQLIDNVEDIANSMMVF